MEKEAYCKNIFWGFMNTLIKYFSLSIQTICLRQNTINFCSNINLINVILPCVLFVSVTKDKEKVQNINDATKIFENFIRDFELHNLGKENRPYLPISSIDALLPLKDKYDIKNCQIDDFLKAYKKTAKGDYKNLRTVSSGEDQPTWDIVRNTELKKLLQGLEENNPELWKDDLPTKEHMELILWAYSPDASKIKKNVSLYEEKLGSDAKSDEENEEMDIDEKATKEKSGKKENEDKTERDKKSAKRKSSGDSSEEESPKKKSRGGDE